MTLQLGHDLTGLRATLHNGPGRRVAIWVQGCRLRCTRQCLNPHYLSHAGGHAIPVESLAAAVIAEFDRVGGQGITVLGGEPTDQAAAVAAVLIRVRSAGYSSMVYTGHVWELHPLVVRADHERRGIGRALVLDLEQRVRELGIHTMFVGSDDETGLTSLAGVDLYPDVVAHLARLRDLAGHPFGFYQRLGYSVIGVMPDANGFGKPDIYLAKRLTPP